MNQNMKFRKRFRDPILHSFDVLRCVTFGMKDEFALLHAFRAIWKKLTSNFGRNLTLKATFLLVLGFNNLFTRPGGLEYPIWPFENSAVQIASREITQDLEDSRTCNNEEQEYVATTAVLLLYTFTNTTEETTRQ